MKKLLAIILMLFFHYSWAQTCESEINQQVWKPFTEAIITQNVEKFVALHSSNLVRAELDSKKVMGLAEYKLGMEKNWPGWRESLKKNQTNYVFELRFTERICNGTEAYEIGYFKNESGSTTGQKRVSYGKFQVALRKENSFWKILVDSDTNLNGTITEEVFLKAQPLK